MKKLSQVIGVISLTVVMGVVFVLPAFAAATITSYDVSCNHFSVSGTSDAPYVVVEVRADFMIVSGAVYPVVGGSYTASDTFADHAPGTQIDVDVFGASDSAGTWDGVLGDYVTENCVEQVLPTPAPGGSTSTFAGPGIPNGFVFVHISCTTAVYDTPAGSPVGAAAVTEGQTWFVNPIPVEGTDGKSWTEIFVSSTINPYIPTNCIG